MIPKEARLSPEAIDQLRKLIADPHERLGINGVEEIKAHPFFRGVDWKREREKVAPNIPQLKHPEDTSIFDDFPEIDPWEETKESKKHKKNRVNDVHFIGYTYKREYENQKMQSIANLFEEIEISRKSQRNANKMNENRANSQKSINSENDQQQGNRDKSSPPNYNTTVIEQKDNKNKDNQNQDQKNDREKSSPNIQKNPSSSNNINSNNQSKKLGFSSSMLKINNNTSANNVKNNKSNSNNSNKTNEINTTHDDDVIQSTLIKKNEEGANMNSNLNFMSNQSMTNNTQANSNANLNFSSNKSNTTTNLTKGAKNIGVTSANLLKRDTPQTNSTQRDMRDLQYVNTNIRGNGSPISSSNEKGNKIKSNQKNLPNNNLFQKEIQSKNTKSPVDVKKNLGAKDTGKLKDAGKKPFNMQFNEYMNKQKNMNLNFQHSGKSSNNNQINTHGTSQNKLGGYSSKNFNTNYDRD